LIPIILQVMKMIQRVSRTNQMVKNNLDHEDNEIVPGKEPASARSMSVFSNPSPGDLGPSRHHERGLAGSHAFVALFMPSPLHHEQRRPCLIAAQKFVLAVETSI
jgi:hypothetical protein